VATLWMLPTIAHRPDDHCYVADVLVYAMLIG
jgi:hypothetical protein